MRRFLLGSAQKRPTTNLSKVWRILYAFKKLTDTKFRLLDDEVVGSGLGRSIRGAMQTEWANHAMVSPTASIVFVVDDDDRVRTAFTRLFRSAGHNVLTFACAKDFLNHVDLQMSPACLVLDVQMPGMTGLELQRELEPAGIPIIFVTGHGDMESSVQALKAGAVDFITKPVLDAQLLSAVSQALEHASRAFKVRREQTEIIGRIDQLTRRERQVMALVLTGMSNKLVASELGAAEKTIKIHRRRVMQKMGARSLVELVRLADKAGFGATDEQSQR